MQVGQLEFSQNCLVSYYYYYYYYYYHAIFCNSALNCKHHV